MVLKYLALIITTFLLNGCNQQNKKFLTAIEIGHPKYYDNREYYIADNIKGATEEDAFYTGLSRIASSISTTIIKSKFNSSIMSTPDSYNKIVNTELHAEVSQIDFNNVIINRNNNSTFMIKVNKQLLLQSYLNKLKRNFSQIEDSLKYSSDFQKYIFLKKYPFEKLYARLNIINYINPKYKNTTEYEEKIRKLQREKNLYKKELSFKVESGDKELKSITNNVLIKSKFDTSSNGKIILNIEMSNMKINTAYHEYYGTANIILKITHNQEIIRKLIEVNTKSMNKNKLKDGLLKDLEQKLYIFLNKEFS